MRHRWKITLYIVVSGYACRAPLSHTNSMIRLSIDISPGAYPVLYCSHIQNHIDSLYESVINDAG